MTKDDDSRIRVTRWIRWIARIWSIPILLYTLLFFIGYAWNMATSGVADPHAVEDVPAIEALPPLLLFLSALGLGIAWRWERLGGVIAILLQVVLLVVLLFQTPLMRDFPRTAIPYVLSLIIIVPGVLFLVSWQRSNR
jgi:fatty acid desaturase